MFLKKKKQENRSKAQLQIKKNYERVYRLHQKAEFLCYVDDAYKEEYKGESYIKLEGVVANGTGSIKDTFILFDCNGRKKAEITVDEFYVGNNSVDVLEGGDKRVAIYPKQQNIPYCAGDILCKIREQIEDNSVDKGEELCHQ